MKETAEQAIGRKIMLGRMFSFYGELLSDSQRSVCSMYLEEDLSMAEIAEQAGVTRQGVHDILTRAFSRLEDCEKKLGMCRRFDSMEQGLQALVKLLNEVRPAPGSEARLLEALRKTEALCRLEEME